MPTREVAGSPRKAGIRRENEARILEAAAQVFAEQGAAGATIGAIAARASVPKANVLYYFGTKDSLHARVLEATTTSWLDAGRAFLAASGPRAAVEAFLAKAGALARAQPHAARLMIDAILPAPVAAKDALTVRALDGLIDDMAARLDEWHQAGIIRPADARTLLCTLAVAAMFGPACAADGDGRGDDGTFSGALFLEGLLH